MSDIKKPESTVPRISLEDAKGHKLLRYAWRLHGEGFLLLFDNGYLSIDRFFPEDGGTKVGQNKDKESHFTDEAAELGIVEPDQYEAWSEDLCKRMEASREALDRRLYYRLKQKFEGSD